MISLILIFLCIMLIYFIIGIFDIQKNMFVKSKNSVSKGQICLTFDDGPDQITTPKILKILNKHNIKGTFFLIGKNIEKNEELVKKISFEGHSIGSHTFSHKFLFPFFSKKKMFNEIKQTNDIITKIIGKRIIHFRPPFGITNININITLNKLKMKSIGWNLRSLDTVINNPIKLYERTTRKIDNGGNIILFHDRCNSTLSVLEKIIKYCIKKNYKFITIDDI